MSSGAKVVSHAIKETTPGVTPTTGQWDILRLTGNTLTPTPNLDQSEEITDSRLSQGSIITSVDINGDLSAELSFGTFDEWLAAGFYGEWVDGVLSIGEKRTTFSIAKDYRDVGVYALFKGAHVRTMAIDIPGEGKVTLSLGLSCMDYEDAEASFVTAKKPVSDTPFVSSISVGTVKVDGQNLEGQACVSGMTMSLDNNLQTQRCLGSGKLGPGALIETVADITGTVTLAWSKKAWEIWKNQMTRKTIAIEFPIKDSLGNEYVFSFPAVEVDGEMPNGGKSDLLEVTLNYSVAKQSPTITRKPATTPEP